MSTVRRSRLGPAAVKGGGKGKGRDVNWLVEESDGARDEAINVGALMKVQATATLSTVAPAARPRHYQHAPFKT